MLKKGSFVDVRVVSVPRALANLVPEAKDGFNELLARAAGVRRSRGTFVMSSNSEILLSSPLWEEIGKRRLRCCGGSRRVVDAM